MITDTVIKILIICAVAILIGIFLGNGAVYMFNRIPASWLTEYGETPSDELLNPTRQRIRSTPYKYLFTALFICVGIYLGMKSPSYALPSLAALWLLLMMSIADIKYMIVPDQFIMILVLSACGFIPFRSGIRDCIFGALIGFALLLLMARLSKLIYKKPGIGGADIKLFFALGLLSGVRGIITIFILSTFLMAGHMVILLITKRAKLTDHRPMVPYIAIASLIQIVFLNFITISL